MPLAAKGKLTTMLNIQKIGVAVVLCHIVANIGIEASKEQCPDVDSMYCTEKQPVPLDCRLTSFITLDDGTECPACQTCVRPEEDPLMVQCPLVPCPMWVLPDSCGPKFYSLKLKVGDELCSLCDTFVCLKKQM